MDVSAWWPVGGPWLAARAQAVSSTSLKRPALKGARVGAHRAPGTMCCSLWEWARRGAEGDTATDPDPAGTVE